MYSILGVKFDVIFVLRNSVLRFFSRSFVKTCLGAPGSGWSRKIMGRFFFLPAVNAYLLLTSLKVCDWSGHVFGASASLRSFTKKHMSPSSTVHGDQHDTKYVTFELLMHAAFVADEIWGFMLEPARTAPGFLGWQ